MNTPILAPNACVDESDVDRGSRRKPSSPRPQSRLGKLLATTLAAPILASTILLWPSTCQATNAGCDGALLRPTGNLTLPATAHARGSAHRDTLGAQKATTHGTLLAGRHVAHIKIGAG